MALKELSRNKPLEVRTNKRLPDNSEKAFAYSMKYRNQLTFRKYAFALSKRSFVVT